MARGFTKASTKGWKTTGQGPAKEPPTEFQKIVKQSAKKKLETHFWIYYVRTMQLDSGCVRQYKWHPHKKFSADFAFPQLGLIVEIQGGVFMPGGGGHSMPASIVADYARMNELQKLGWTVLQYARTSDMKSFPADYAAVVERKKKGDRQELGTLFS